MTYKQARALTTNDKVTRTASDPRLTGLVIATGRYYIRIQWHNGRVTVHSYSDCPELSPQ